MASRNENDDKMLICTKCLAKMEDIKTIAAHFEQCNVDMSRILTLAQYKEKKIPQSIFGSNSGFKNPTKQKLTDTERDNEILKTVGILNSQFLNVRKNLVKVKKISEDLIEIIDAACKECTIVKSNCENLKSDSKNKKDNLRVINTSKILEMTQKYLGKQFVSSDFKEFDFFQKEISDSYAKLLSSAQIIFPEISPLKYIYGNTYNENYGKALCRRIIANSSIIQQMVSTSGNPSVLQMKNHVFITGGGFNLSCLQNSLFEYNENDDKFEQKACMFYAKGMHRMILINDYYFWTIGGINVPKALNVCEEYSIRDNIWKLLPTLNYSRVSPGAVLSGSYVYAIGGADSLNSIERIDLLEKNEWENVKIKSCTLNFTKTPAAFLISPFQIMIFKGDITDSVGIYDILSATVKKSEFYKAKPDEYWTSTPVISKGIVYIFGNLKGYLHNFNFVTKKIDRSYSDTNNFRTKIGEMNEDFNSIFN